jgi:hypothetical protein
MSTGNHTAETDCVAGVVGLELENPLGSKSARIAGEFPPIWAKRRSRDSSRPSCGIANVQLQQGFCVVRLGSGGGFADVLEDLRGRDPRRSRRRCAGFWSRPTKDP